MILGLCRDVKDKKFFPLLSFPCIVAPLKLLEAIRFFLKIKFYLCIDFTVLERLGNLVNGTILMCVNEIIIKNNRFYLHYKPMSNRQATPKQ